MTEYPRVSDTKNCIKGGFVSAKIILQFPNSQLARLNPSRKSSFPMAKFTNVGRLILAALSLGVHLHFVC